MKSVSNNPSYLVIPYFLIVYSVDSYLLVDRGVTEDTSVGFENADYFTSPIQRIPRAPQHVHKSRGEDFLCKESKKSNDGEGQAKIDEVCPRNKLEEIRQSVIALSCGTPHLKTVKLKLVGPNYDLVPSVARVKRCSGHCTHPRTCLPFEKSIVRIPVLRIDRTKNEPTICVDFELEEHKSCRCGCMIEERHCTANQIYDESKCACICSNQEAKERCLELAYAEPNSRYWDDTTCQCHCVPLDCPRSMLWVPTLCRCAMVSDERENALY